VLVGICAFCWSQFRHNHKLIFGAVFEAIQIILVASNGVLEAMESVHAIARNESSEA
jgi:hypothetical protein